jgi:hypothetical protein
LAGGTWLLSTCRPALLKMSHLLLRGAASLVHVLLVAMGVLLTRPRDFSSVFIGPLGLETDQAAVRG